MGDWLNAIVLGIVEGLTEFLPVSSTGHMILAGELLDFHGERADTFKIVVQLGAVLAVLVLYWERFVGFLKPRRGEERSGLNLGHVLLAMAPAIVAGLTLYRLIKDVLFGPGPVLLSLIFGGVLMIAAEKAGRRVTAETMDDLTYRQAFGIGLFQCLALWPGFSRSGSTISGGMLLGASQKAAAEFTFIVSVPMMFAASGLDLYQSREHLVREDLALFLIGLAAAFVVAMIAIVTFLNLVKRLRLSWFAYYRFALAALFYFIIYR
ncbi:undecaprenyl-diphosphate phosphatase [Paenibacillus ginsengihumi]|uniref:undecaprenyl-diphosphate phosphatase n=1 Tax=Paenibacillus ginsengihumi TaxID=431596 RepID=UPI00035E812D|nr:undecaprenyl-diphosphate phosphatase [Paenibacillus ginsengihumi]